MSPYGRARCSDVCETRAPTSRRSSTILDIAWPLATSVKRKHTLTEVAYLLGYSEVSAFNRAFRRWTAQRHRTTAAGSPVARPIANGFLVDVDTHWFLRSLRRVLCANIPLHDHLNLN